MYSGPVGGIWSSPNPWSSVPEGSLKVADNTVFVAPGIMEPRRGFTEGATFGTNGSLADAMAFYSTNLLVAYDFTRIAIKPAATEAFFAWAETFAPNGTNRMRFEAAARSVFFNPVSGIRVFDGSEGFFTGSVVDASIFALSYSTGVGMLYSSGTVTGTTSGAIGTLLVFAGQSDVAGTMSFSAISSGPFQDGEILTGDGGWTGIAVGGSTIALRIDDASADFIEGLNVAGETSGATAVINAVEISGSDGVLGLREIIGTFVDPEGIAVGESTLEPTMAGCPQGLNIVVVPSADNAWQLPDSAVAYRFTVCRKDSFGRIIEGPPSGRTVPRNQITSTFGTSGVTRSSNVVFVTTDTAHGLTSGDFVTQAPADGTLPTGFPAGLKGPVTVINDIQFSYAEIGSDGSATITLNWLITRSGEVTCYFPDDCTIQNFLRVYRSFMSETATTPPDDELFQVYESAFLSDAELANGYLTFDDVAPESILEIPLYTNQNTGDGTLAANYRPPIAEDMAYWQNRMWYLNTTSKHSAQLTLIGVGSPDGLQADDELTFSTNDGADAFTFTAKASPGSVLEFALFDDADPGYNIQRTAQALVQAINDYPVSPGDNLPYAFYISSESGQPGRILMVARQFGDTYAFKLSSSRPTPWTPQLPDNVSPLWPDLASENNRHAARLWYSKLGQPEAVPLLNNLEIDSDNNPALKMEPLNYRLLVWKTDGLYFVPNTEPFGMQKLSDDVLVAPDSVRRLGDMVYFLSDRGLMTVDDSGVRSASKSIDVTLDALNGATSLTSLRQRTFAMPYRSMEQYILWLIERSTLDEFSDDNAQAFVYSQKASGFTRYTFGARCGVINTATDTLVLAPTDDNRLWYERKSLTDTDYNDIDDVPIECEVVFNDFTEREPAVMKMAQQCSFLFKENGISEITALFASEIHPTAIEVPILNPGWGGFSWGEEPWGGFVRTIRRIQPLPVGVANSCQLSVGFRASVSGVKFGFLGIDLISGPDTIANRG